MLPDIVEIVDFLTMEKAKKLKAGDMICFSGVIYTARDRAHKKLVELIKKKKKLPVDPRGAIIYYCGPNIKGDRLGSCGPTTSSRVDTFVEPLLKKGVRAMIGKGVRSGKVRSLCKKYGAVYFLTHGGCGAYLRTKVRSFSPAAFPGLGPEAVYRLEVKDFPLIVGIDSRGKDIYEKLIKDCSFFKEGRNNVQV